MRTFVLLCLILSVFTLQSCNDFKSKHPQAGIANHEGATNMNDKSILNFAASIDRTLNLYKKEISLVYLSGDLSMYAEKYSGHDDGKLYKTFTANGNISSTVKSYYFKNDSLILVKEHNRLTNNGEQIYKDVRTYIRNNVTFKMDSRTASSSAAITKLPYLPVQAADNKYPEEDFAGDVNSMDDAISGKDKFEMVFENITTYPEVHYINLKSKGTSNYKASLLVNKRDLFIDSLLDMPGRFKDEKLKLNWKIEDREAVYVPVDSTITSASGLKR